MLVGHVLEGLHSQGITFDSISLSSLRRFDEASQIATLEKVKVFLRNPSALLMHLLGQDQTQGCMQMQVNVRGDAPVGVQQAAPTVCTVGQQHMEHQSLVTARMGGPHVESIQAPDASVPLLSAAGAVPIHSETSDMPPSQYLMCLLEPVTSRCSDVELQCVHGATEPPEVKHGISLCSSELAYLTVCRVRKVESFPWELPAGWYALHVANHGLSEEQQRQVAAAGIAIPSNLPANCIVALVKLGPSKPFRDFAGDSWACEQWCQATEDVIMLQSCVPMVMQEQRRFWILPERVRTQVQQFAKASVKPIPRDAAHTVLVNGRIAHLFKQEAIEPTVPATLLDVCTPSRSTNGLLSQEGGHGCKRVCLPSLLHASFPQHAPAHIDRLQKLYPHPRDQDCYLDDRLHKYYVHGARYDLSVSGWWKMYFEEFDATRVSERIVQRQLGTPGFRASPSGDISESALASSIYNFAQHIRVFERRGDSDYLEALQAVALAARDDYARHGACCPFPVGQIVEVGHQFLVNPQKPDGVSCYYLVLLYTSNCGPEVQAVQLARTWDIHGSLESLKGTYLHKKIELFINAMARPMERDGTSRVAVEELLKEEPPAHEYGAEVVMRHIAWAQDPELWDHPLAQSFFASEVRGESVEFQKFRLWLWTKPRWTPFRLEWSLYNEDLKVAGQIDSLWLDLDRGGTLVMADWKRARQLLTNDVTTLELQSCGKMGTSCCSHLYDTAWSHYFVQQTLYAYMLASKYGLVVRQMMLVQCHPHVCGPHFNEAPLVPDFELAEALARILSQDVATRQPLGLEALN